MASKLTGSRFRKEFKVTTNTGTDVTLTPVPAETTIDMEGITTVVLNGAGAHYPSANGPERFEVTISKSN